MKPNLQLKTGTLEFVREIKAEKSLVFQAFQDPRTREIWSSPGGDEEVRIVSEGFQEDGVEVQHCGTKGNMEYRVKLQYFRIVPDHLIVFSESLARKGQPIIATAMTSFHFEDGEEVDTTRLKVVIHVVSYVGDDMLEGYRAGYTHGLDNLKKFVEGKA